MKPAEMLAKRLRWLLAVCLSMALMACANVGGTRLVSHAFNFNGWHDGWQSTVELLEYSYGDQYAKVRGKAKDGHSAGVSSGVNGPMPVGEFLYVKWRLKASNEMFEQRVDLRDRLPRNMTDHELTFVIEGSKLYVYVVLPQAQAKGVKQRTHRTWLSRYNLAYEIYPERQSAPGS